MTNASEKVYEETYQGYKLEIHRVCKMTPDGTGVYHYKVTIDNCELPGEFDEYFHFPNIAEMFFEGMNVDFKDPSFAMLNEVGEKMPTEEVKQLLSDDLNRNYKVENIQTPPQESQALKAAREYCDRAIADLKVLEERGDEMLVLRLSDEEAELLQRVLKVIGERPQLSLQALQKRLNLLR
ncbi:hypothetical protein [Oscillatoria sp. FACHB-1406]|uniref:hypothetical protein n=1 Tax=Oscillatoria sp. FACHB-1406 TaxID=2692846 RepID=UPI001681FFA8|nr:hypothetical protein [Oscillatoria sp. FACHB-1406]MBD2576772.1 hypothetical protein [Oscillatoria sp. FACHB-1406]